MMLGENSHEHKIVCNIFSILRYYITSLYFWVHRIFIDKMELHVYI
jgi:hypothetical protein